MKNLFFALFAIMFISCNGQAPPVKEKANKFGELPYKFPIDTTNCHGLSSSAIVQTDPTHTAEYQILFSNVVNKYVLRQVRSGPDLKSGEPYSDTSYFATYDFKYSYIWERTVFAEVNNHFYFLQPNESVYIDTKCQAKSILRFILKKWDKEFKKREGWRQQDIERRKATESFKPVN